MKDLLRASPLLGLLICSSVFGDQSQTEQPADVSAAPPPTSIPTPAHSCAELKAFKDAMHKAINDALKYPHELVKHPTTGVTSVAYDYADGQVSNVRITMFSGDEMLDRVALTAVKDADYASISPRIDDQTIHDLVIIVFDNTGELDHEAAMKGAKKKQAATDANCGE